MIRVRLISSPGSGGQSAVHHSSASYFPVVGGNFYLHTISRIVIGLAPVRMSDAVNPRCGGFNWYHTVRHFASAPWHRSATDRFVVCFSWTIPLSIPGSAFRRLCAWSGTFCHVPTTRSDLLLYVAIGIRQIQHSVCIHPSPLEFLYLRRPTWNRKNKLSVAIAFV